MRTEKYHISDASLLVKWSFRMQKGAYLYFLTEGVFIEKKNINPPLFGRTCLVVSIM